MTTQAAAPESSGTGASSVSTTSGTIARGRLLRRWLAGAMVLGLVTVLLTGWVSNARAATTDRLAALNARIDERVSAGRAMAERLTTVVVVARDVQADSAGADPTARARLDAAIRSAEGVLGQRITTQAPATVPQAEMLVEQAGVMEEALALATVDLRIAVDRVRVSRGDLRPEPSWSHATDERAADERAGHGGADVVMAVARP